MRAKDFIVEKVITEKNVPTNPSKWNYYKNQAKKKFDVYPSAYANGWAAKKYKAAGGKWKTESVEHDTTVITELSVSGESTNKLLMYYTKFKNAVTANERRILDAISKELERRKINYKQLLAADQYTTEAEQSPYAIGMAKAMKMYKDKPPLAKKTIKKAHEIAKAIQKD